MRDFTEDLAEVARRVREAHHYLGINVARDRLAQLEKEASAPDLWDDPDRARKISGDLSVVRDDVELVDGLERRVSDVETLFGLAREESDESLVAEIAAEID